MLFNKNENKPASSIEEKIKLYRRQGHIVPPRKIIKNAEQIEGIRESAKINTAVLDHVAANIREGMSTEDINTLVYDFTVAHGAIPAPLNYEGFPKSVCTSINEEVCHGIPDKNIILRSGDIINVDVSTIYNGYFSDCIPYVHDRGSCGRSPKTGTCHERMSGKRHRGLHNPGVFSETWAP